MRWLLVGSPAEAGLLGIPEEHDVALWRAARDADQVPFLSVFGVKKLLNSLQSVRAKLNVLHVVASVSSLYIKSAVHVPPSLATHHPREESQCTGEDVYVPPTLNLPIELSTPRRADG
jgi:hypothetical protein